MNKKGNLCPWFGMNVSIKLYGYCTNCLELVLYFIILYFLCLSLEKTNAEKNFYKDYCTKAWSCFSLPLPSNKAEMPKEYNIHTKIIQHMESNRKFHQFVSLWKQEIQKRNDQELPRNIRNLLLFHYDLTRLGIKLWEMPQIKQKFLSLAKPWQCSSISLDLHFYWIETFWVSACASIHLAESPLLSVYCHFTLWIKTSQRF